MAIICLTLYSTIPTFSYPRRKSFENILRKGENAGNQHFLPFPRHFQTCQGRFEQHRKSRLQIISVWTLLKFCRNGKELTLYSIDTHFDASTTDSYENIVGKEEIARNEQFLLFPTMFSTQSDNCILICPYF